MMLNIVILLIAINNSIVLSVLVVIMFTETERRLHEHRQKSFIWGRCKKYSDQTDQTDQTGQMTKDIFGDSQVGSLAWELVYF